MECSSAFMSSHVGLALRTRIDFGVIEQHEAAPSSVTTEDETVQRSWNDSAVGLCEHYAEIYVPRSSTLFARPPGRNEITIREPVHRCSPPDDGGSGQREQDRHALSDARLFTGLHLDHHHQRFPAATSRAVASHFTCNTRAIVTVAPQLTS